MPYIFEFIDCNLNMLVP